MSLRYLRAIRPALRACALAVSLAPLAHLVACGSSSSGNGAGSSGGNDGGQGASSSGSSSGGSSSGSAEGGGARAPFPTITNHGVAVLASPKIVAVTFNGDSNAAAVGSFVSSVGATPWWTAVTKDYGVGPATGSSVAVTATLETQYTDSARGTLPDGGTPSMPTFVAQTVTTAPGMPAPDANTVYAFFLPSTTTVSVDGIVTCAQAGGYHRSTTAGGKTIVYAVIPECANATLVTRAFPNETDFLTFAASHEILEAVTDPTLSESQVGLTAGYYNDFLDDLGDDLSWDTLADGEVADFCVDQFGFQTYDDVATAGSNTVQRIWSISAAKAGSNPCVPIPTGEVYFNASPAAGQDVVVADQNTPVTLDVNAFADGAISSWTVIALDGQEIQGGAPALTLSFQGGTTESEPGLKISAPSVSATNGATLQLSITLTAALSPTSNPFATGILISHDGASLVSSTADHYWPFIVTTSAIAQEFGLGLSAPPRFQGQARRALSVSAISAALHARSL